MALAVKGLTALSDSDELAGQGMTWQDTTAYEEHVKVTRFTAPDSEWVGLRVLISNWCLCPRGRQACGFCATPVQQGGDGWR